MLSHRITENIAVVNQGIGAIRKSVSSLLLLKSSPWDNVTVATELMRSDQRRYSVQKGAPELLGRVVTLTESSKHNYTSAVETIRGECQTAIPLLELCLQNIECSEDQSKANMQKKLLLQIVSGFKATLLAAKDRLKTSSTSFQDAADELARFSSRPNGHGESNNGNKYKAATIGICLAIFLFGCSFRSTACIFGGLVVSGLVFGYTKIPTTNPINATLLDTAQKLSQAKREVQRVEDMINSQIHYVCDSSVKLDGVSSAVWVSVEFADSIQRSMSELLETCSQLVRETDL